MKRRTEYSPSIGVLLFQLLVIMIGNNRSIAGIAGYVASTGDIANVPDIRLDSRFDLEVDQLPEKKSDNILCLPIKNENGDILGVMEMINKRQYSIVYELIINKSN
jgi:hypothetical protein